VNVIGAKTFVYGGVLGTGTPDYADLSVVLNGNSPINFGGSLYGAADNTLQFLDANGDIQANIPNVTSMSWFQQVYTLDFVNGANVPPGSSRNGQTFAIQWAAGTGTNSTVAFQQWNCAGGCYANVEYITRHGWL